MDSRLNNEAQTTTAADNLTKCDQPNTPQAYKQMMPNKKKRFNDNIGCDKNNSRLSAERRAEYIAEDQQIDTPNTEENIESFINIRLDSSAAMGQSKMNNDLGRGHRAFILRGRQKSSGTTRDYEHGSLYSYMPNW